MKIFQLIDSSMTQEMRDEALSMACALKSSGNRVEVFHRLEEEMIAPFKEEHVHKNDNDGITAGVDRGGFKVRRCRLGGSLDFISPVIIARDIYKDDAVVIQVFSTDTLLCAARVRQLAPDGARVAIVFHCGRRMPDFTRPTRQRLADEVSAYIFSFADDARRFSEAMPDIPSDRVCVVAPSLLQDIPLPSPARVRDADASFTVLFYGSILPAKGLDRLIAALENMTSEKLKVIVAGTGQGRDVMPILRRTRASAVDSMIDWAGDPRDPHTVIAGADVAVFPSVTECDDYRPMLMAMLHGLPVIASSRSSAPQIFESGERFMTVDTDNPDLFAEAIRNVMNDHTLRQRLSTASLSRYSEMCGTNDAATRLESIYISLLNYSK